MTHAIIHEDLDTKL